MAMQPWFSAAKLGIFVHWGIYAVDGVAESWSFFNGQVPYDTYMKQLDGFTAARFDPESWAELFAASGARYAVLTTKHHDGVALWDTPANDLSTVHRTPAARDLVTEFAAAIRRRGLRLGLYYSHLDWSHPDYPTLGPKPGEQPHSFSHPPAGTAPSPERWERFLSFHRAQIAELQTQFSPDLLWFDGDWERTAEQWRMAELREEIHSRQPEVVLNGRMLGHGDYPTPEQGVPIVPPDGPWELCLTINDSWGWQRGDENHKSVRQIIRVFAETIGAGGNLLLDVGPRADGTITAPQEARLRALGDWIARHREAVFDTVRGLPAGHFHGASTLSGDRRTLYLIAFDRPNEHLVLRGLRNRVLRARVLGSDTALPVTVSGGLGEVPGWTYITAPADSALDPHATVLALELDGPLNLHRA